LAWNYAEHGGNLDVALGLAQKAREANPGDPDIADTLGWIYFKKGAFESALHLFIEANEKLKDSSPTLLYHLGMAYRKIGNDTSAKEVLSKALVAGKSFPESAEAQRVLDELQARKPS
jgi:tetratricopeptide (TPR) repeat protein